MLLSMYNIMIKSTNNKNLVPVEVISLVPGAAVVRAGMTWMLNYNIIKMQTNKTNCGCGVLLIPGSALSGLAMTWMLFTMKLVPGTAVVRTGNDMDAFYNHKLQTNKSYAYLWL